jgi:peptide/nickel transport system substrate-binding protein
MDVTELRRMINNVKRGRLSRRGFIRRMAAVGIAAPFANQILSIGGVAMAATPFTYKPTKRGGGGTLKVLWWQAPTLLNPHFATGTKDQDGSRIFYEPLAGWDGEGNLVPKLAAEIPSIENGGLAKDGMSVTWKLKQGVKWHDGKPFTADDVVFNWEFASNPQTAAVTSGSYTYNKAVKVDDYTVRVEFKKPTPFWADPFVGATGMLIPKHIFEPFMGAKAHGAPANLTPVGTGPFKFKDFRPGEFVSGVINTDYHEANKPYFDAIEMKGGGDATSAARAVLETGEYDYAWNLQVEDKILTSFEKAGKATVRLTPGANIEHIQLNNTDPNKEVDGERSSLKAKHPTLTDPAVRQAMALLIDRGGVQKYIYGRTAVATSNYVNNPPRYVSKNTHWEFNIAKANEILDKAGYKKGADGIREKNGHKLKYVFQTSINGPRQKNQEIVKQACAKAGIAIDIKAVVASVFFSSDVANPDTYPKFYADLQMYTTGPSFPDPWQWMASFVSTNAAQKSNNWQGRNITRWSNPEYDKVYAEAGAEMDPIKRTALLIKMNDLAVDGVAIIPELYRMSVSAAAKNLAVNLSGWEDDMWDVGSWYRNA